MVSNLHRNQYMQTVGHALPRLVGAVYRGRNGRLCCRLPRLSELLLPAVVDGKQRESNSVNRTLLM